MTSKARNIIGQYRVIKELILVQPSGHRKVELARGHLQFESTATSLNDEDKEVVFIARLRGSLSVKTWWPI